MTAIRLFGLTVVLALVLPACPKIGPPQVDPPGTFLHGSQVQDMLQAYAIDLQSALRDLAKAHAVTPFARSLLEEGYVAPRLDELEEGFAELARMKLPAPESVAGVDMPVDKLITSRRDCIYYESAEKLSLLTSVAAGRGTPRWITLVPDVRPMPSAGEPGNHTGWVISSDSVAQDHPCRQAP